MRAAAIALALALTAASAAAQQSALQQIIFKWSGSEQKGFAKETKELGRYDTLDIDVDKTAFATAAAAQLGDVDAAREPLDAELNALARTAKAFRAYHDALAAEAAARATGTPMPDSTSQRLELADALLEFRRAVRRTDPATYDAVSKALADRTDPYGNAAQVIEQRMNAIAAALQKSLAAGALGITATLVPPDDAARALHLKNYDQNPESAAAAMPTYIPVVDERTRREIAAAQDFIDVASSLHEIGPNLRQSVTQLRQALDQLRTTLQTNVLQANLTALQNEIRGDATQDFAPLRTSVAAALALVRKLDAATLQLDGADDAARLLGLADMLSTTSENLESAVTGLPTALNTLVPQIESALRTRTLQTGQQALASVKTAATAFAQQQTFFVTLAEDVKTLAAGLESDSRLALSAERVASTARNLDVDTDYGTALDVSRIPGDVHVRDNVVIRAALYRRDDGGALKVIDEAEQSFVIQRYGLYPENVRGGLIFAQPRSKIERDVDYQPVPALGYYWRVGLRGRPAWNAASPSFGLALSLLDFKDQSDVELGIAGSVTLLRDVVWIGYGRNLQAKANYFFIGGNPLLLTKTMANR